MSGASLLACLLTSTTKQAAGFGVCVWLDLAGSLGVAVLPWQWFVVVRLFGQNLNPCVRVFK